MSVYHVIFELASFALTSLVVLHAIKKGRGGIIQVISLILFGIGLEYLSIPFTGAYHYTGFLFMLGPAPICIGLFWMCIIYSAMETSDRLKIRKWTRPFLDGLLALNIDLAMDAIAIRLGFWHWGIQGQWYGVPYANFFGWFNFVFAYSAITRVLRYYLEKNNLRKWVDYSWLLGVPPTLGVVLLSNSVMELGLEVKSQEMLLAGLVITSILIVMVFNKRLKCQGIKREDRLYLATPFFLHAFFLFALIEKGFFISVPILLLVSISMMVLGVGVHLFPYNRAEPDIIS